MSKSITTPIGRVSFPNLVKPQQYMPESKPKYSLALLLPKNDPKVPEFLKWLKEAVTAEATAVAGAKNIQAAMSNFTNLKDGDNVSLFKTYRSEYAGHYILNMSRNAEYNKPRTVNRDKQDIDPSEIYAGCNARAYIDVFGYTAGPKKGVTVGVQHVQKTGENTPFTSTGVPVNDAFSELDLPAEDAYAGVEDLNPAPTAAPTGPVVPPTRDPFAGV